MVPLRIEPDLVKKLHILALKRNLYRSELIREAIRDLILKYDALDKVAAIRA